MADGLSFGGAGTSREGLSFGGGPGLSLGQKVSGFALSTIESFPELFGIEPSETTQKFRAQAPISGFLSQAAGMFVPYLGAAKAARAVPLIGAGLTALESLGGESAILRGALGAAGEAGVVEAGRLGISATPIPAAVYDAVTGTDKVREKPLSVMAGESLVNVGAGAALGGVAGGLMARLAKGRKISEGVVDADPSRPVPVQAQSLNEVIRKAQDPLDPFTVDDETLAKLENQRNDLIKINLLDQEPSYADDGRVRATGEYKQGLEKMYRPLPGDKKDEVVNFLNRINSAGVGKRASPNLKVRRLVYDPTGATGYANEADMAADLDALGKHREEVGLLTQDFKTVMVPEGEGRVPMPEDFTLPPDTRILTSPPEFAKPPNDPLTVRATNINKRFTNSKVWSDVGDGFRVAVEADSDGMFVMNKLVRGDIANPAPGDRYAVFRTANPEAFAERAAGMNKIVRDSAYYPPASEILPVNEPLYQAGAAAKKLVGENIPRRLVRAAKTTAESVARESLQTLGAFAAPTDPLVSRNPIMAAAWQIAKDVYTMADGRVAAAMRGPATGHIDPEKSIAGNLLAGKKAQPNSIEYRLAQLGQKDLNDVQFVYMSELPIEKVRALATRMDVNGDPLISPPVLEFFEAMQTISDNFANRAGELSKNLMVDTAQKAVAEFQSRAGHYVISREFPGGIRIALTDEDGKLVGMATGGNPLEAKKKAAELIESQAKRGRKIRESGLVDEGLMSATQIADMQKAMRRPGFLKSRGDLLGYEMMMGELSSQKLSKLLEKNLIVRERFLADAVVREHTADLLAKLERTNRQDAQIVKKRLSALAGDEGPFGKFQNDAMDKVLNVVGLTGKNSASAIVRATQHTLTQHTFGFANLTGPINNLLGVFQTLLPEVSFVVNATEETLRRYYMSVPLMDGAGGLKGTLGVLSTPKIFLNSMRMLGTPIKNLPGDYRQLVADMISDRQLDPRFAERYMGETGEILSDPKAMFQDLGSFAKYMMAVNELPMSKTEEISRAMTLNAAYQLAKLQNLPYDRMRVFTREMFAKVNYNYSTADRATVWTTPLGSLSGTFKNWMFHYMGSMMRYAGEGKDGLVPLFWQTASTALIGGAVATPLAMPLANAASKFLTDKTALQNLYAAAGQLGMSEHVADGVMYGLPGSLGLSLGTQVASPGSDPKRDAQMIFSFAALDRVRALSSGTKDALVAYRTTGESPWEDANVRAEMVRAFAPRTIYRSMALSQDLAIKSLGTGYDVTHPMGLGGALLYATGFTPTELAKTYDVYNEVRDEQNKQLAVVKELGQTLAQAWQTSDDRLANRVFMRAAAIGVDTSSVLRSAEARTKRQGETQLEFAASPEDREAFSFMFGDEQ